MQKAYLNGNAIVAFDLDRDMAGRIQQAQRRSHSALVDSAGRPVVLRAGRRRTWHFALRHGETAPESAEHVNCKRIIRDCALRVGWEAEVESRSEDGSWVADVLVTIPGGRRVAWEVQLSAQSEEDYLRRTARYAEAGTETIWVCSSRRAEYQPEGWDARLSLLPYLADEEQMSDLVLRAMRYWQAQTDGAIPADAQPADHVWCRSCGCEMFVTSDDEPASDELRRHAGDLLADRGSRSTWYGPLTYWSCPHCTDVVQARRGSADRTPVLVYGNAVAVPARHPLSLSHRIEVWERERSPD